MAYYTKEQLLSETDSGVPVDLILRAGGRLHMVIEGLDWDSAVIRALSAMEDHLTVEIEESDKDWYDEDECY